MKIHQLPHLLVNERYQFVEFLSYWFLFHVIFKHSNNMTEANFAIALRYTAYQSKHMVVVHVAIKYMLIKGGKCGMPYLRQYASGYQF